ncbi:hypothetical protein Y1Q_0005830 [Alligator mississippiensis]|uniref:Uncharacterized protein n=1 Tax=Alligator mississippiensis TaxID=8496 RepID=A0A151MG27_ALLMI|nr:hypothetical protein Y1Q_0005830 [Alligator mississippiensis]
MEGLESREQITVLEQALEQAAWAYSSNLFRAGLEKKQLYSQCCGQNLPTPVTRQPLRTLGEKIGTVEVSCRMLQGSIMQMAMSQPASTWSSSQPIKRTLYHSPTVANNNSPTGRNSSSSASGGTMKNGQKQGVCRAAHALVKSSKM